MAKLYKGWGVKLYKDGTEIGYATSATVDISAGTEAIFQMGDYKAVEVVRGNLEITGTIERACVDKALLDLITGKETGSAVTQLTEFDFKCSLAVPAPSSGEMQILTVQGCKPETEALDVPQDGVFTESIDFIAKGFKVETAA